MNQIPLIIAVIILFILVIVLYVVVFTKSSGTGSGTESDSGKRNGILEMFINKSQSVPFGGDLLINFDEMGVNTLENEVTPLQNESIQPQEDTVIPSNKFRINSDGIYLIYYSVTWESNQTGARVVDIRIDPPLGLPWYARNSSINAGTETSQTGSVAFDVKKDSIIWLDAYHSSNQPVSILYAGITIVKIA